MTLPEFTTALKRLSFPTAYGFFKTAQSPPYAVWYKDGDEVVKADDSVAAKIPSVALELYTNKKDLQKEAEIEALLDELNIVYDVAESFIADEKLRLVRYDFLLY